MEGLMVKNKFRSRHLDCSHMMEIDAATTKAALSPLPLQSHDGDRCPPYNTSPSLDSSDVYLIELLLVQFVATVAFTFSVYIYIPL